MSALDTPDADVQHHAHGAGATVGVASPSRPQRGAQPPGLDTRGAPSSITITIPGQPVPKARPRVAGRRAYTPARTAAATKRVAEAVAPYVGTSTLAGPQRVDAVFILQRPLRLRRKRDPRGVMWNPRRPDVDNLAKLLLDGMAALWHDDAQAVCGRFVKLYAAIDGEPRTVVRVSPAGDVPEWAIALVQHGR